MTETRASVAVRPVIGFARETPVGASSILSVDLVPVGDDWPPGQEEEIVECLLDATPLFDQRPLDDGVIVVHRFGGSYGPARFLLTAREAGEGGITIGFTNQWGIPFDHVRI